MASVVFDIDYEFIVSSKSKIQVVVAHQARPLPARLVLVEQCNVLSLGNLETLADLLIELLVLNISRESHGNEVITKVDLDL